MGDPAAMRVALSESDSSRCRNVESQGLARLLTCFDGEERDAPFYRQVGIMVRAAVAAFRAEHATVWVPVSDDQYAMAYTTFPDEIASVLIKRRAHGETRTALCFREGRPHFYATLNTLPACVHLDLLQDKPYTSTWCLPVHVRKLIPNQILCTVITLDGRPDLMRGDIDSQFLDRIARWAANQIERAVWAEQDTLVRQMHTALGLLEHSAAQSLTTWPAEYETCCGLRHAPY